MSKTKKRAKKKARSKAKAAGLKHVVVTARNYGNKLKGVKIYYEGSKPGGLRPDGTINLGKNILEILRNSLERSSGGSFPKKKARSSQVQHRQGENLSTPAPEDEFRAD
jgi:hypothetical protein